MRAALKPLNYDYRSTLTPCRYRRCRHGWCNRSMYRHVPRLCSTGYGSLIRSTIRASGKLSISDTQIQERLSLDTHGLGFNYSGQYGDLLLRKDGTGFITQDTGQIFVALVVSAAPEEQPSTSLVKIKLWLTRLPCIQKMVLLTDIVITIHGKVTTDLARASEVQFNSQRRPSSNHHSNRVRQIQRRRRQRCRQAPTIANLHADHGSTRATKMAPIPSHPIKIITGKCTTYNVKDAHHVNNTWEQTTELGPSREIC